MSSLLGRSRFAGSPEIYLFVSGGDATPPWVLNDGEAGRCVWGVGAAEGCYGGVDGPRPDGPDRYHHQPSPPSRSRHSSIPDPHPSQTGE